MVYEEELLQTQFELGQNRSFSRLFLGFRIWNINLLLRGGHTLRVFTRVIHNHLQLS